MEPTRAERVDVTRAMAGDHDAFAVLANANADRLYALARSILRDADRADDATQEALVRAWRDLPGLRDPSRFQAWLRRLLVNACYDEGRRLRSRAEVVLLSDHHPAIDDASGPVIDRDRLDRAFRRLPLEQRVVTVLNHVEGLSHEEIAATLGLPLGTVKSRARYALIGLRAALEADDRGSAPPDARRRMGIGGGRR
jgi:RNA polymerase sigma-70 factor (ECF subfamily)